MGEVIKAESRLVTAAAGQQVIVFQNMQEVLKAAELMSNAKHVVPDFYLGNPGACMAIIMQAQRWGMDPFLVASKTHIVQGRMGYEAQLINAVVQASGACGRFHYEYRGEKGALECRVGAVIAGEKDITWGEWLGINDVKTQNSPLWKTNPRQQLGYLQVKNWARAYCPGAALGLYTPDEIREEVDITPAGDPPKPAPSRTESVKAKLKAEEATASEAVIVDADDAVDMPQDLVAELAEEQAADLALTYAMVAEQYNKAQGKEQIHAADQLAHQFLSDGDNAQYREELGDVRAARLLKLKAQHDANHRNQ